MARRMVRNFTRPLATAVLACATLIASAASALADDVFTYGRNGQPPVAPFWQDVSVLRIEDEKVIFRTRAGDERSAEIRSIFRIAAGNDPVFTAADESFVKREWDKAADGYLRVARGNEAWKLRWCAPRLVEAAAKANRFDAAVSGYIAFAKTDPAAAAALKPTLPPRGSKFLDDAAKDLDAALRVSTKDPERQALLALLLDVQLARGDRAGAEATADRVIAIAGNGAANDPRLAALVSEIRISQARAALESKRYDAVTQTIDAIADRLTEPRQQAEALYLLAEAKLGTARADDKRALADAGIAYMRVVAHFREVDGRPFVGESLMRTAQVHEQLGELPAARAVYAQVQTDLPGTPFAADAARQLHRLEAAAAGK